MVTPAATAARMPEQCRCSASRYAPKGISRLIKICEPVSSPKCRDTQFFATVTIQVMPTPSTNPPIVAKDKRRQKQQEEDIRLKCNAEIGHRGDDRSKCDLNER